MLKLLTNVTTLAGHYHFESIFNQLWTVLANISAPYAVCGSIIVLCMFATTLRNLIYKVLNLAVLSVFVVALWAYLTDVTFIYVVYILTFVSAVVMLFLSVVLMLPSSAIAVTKRNFLFILSTTTGVSTSETSVVSTIASIATDIVYICLALSAVYFVVAAFKSWKTLRTYHFWGHPSINVVLEPEEVSKLPKRVPSTYYASPDLKLAKKFTDSYFFYVYGEARVNRQAILDCKTDPAYHVFNFSDFFHLRHRFCIETGYKAIQTPWLLKPTLEALKFRYGYGSGEEAIYGRVPNFEVIDSFYPKYIRAVPRLVQHGTPNWYHDRRAIAMIPYEFINFYVHRLEPELFTTFPRYMAATAALRRFANATRDCVEYHCYADGGRSPLIFKLNENPAKTVYLSIYTPWWSPFRVFGFKPKGPNRIDLAVHNLIVWLEDREGGKMPRYPNKTNVGPTVNSYIPPSLSQIISDVTGRLISPLKNITSTFYLLYYSFGLHPSTSLKLTDEKGSRLMRGIQFFNAAYYRVINFIFSYVELPLSSSTGGKSGFGVFSGFYDMVIPTHSSRVFEIFYTINPAQYVASSTRLNRLVFIKNFITFTAANLFLNLVNASVCFIIFLNSPTNVELAVQVITALSIFFIAVPVGLSGSWATFTYSSFLTNVSASVAENLAAIQQGLYVSQPLILLVSITGLLVALIGAPFFVSRNNK